MQNQTAVEMSQIERGKLDTYLNYLNPMLCVAIQEANHCCSFIYRRWALFEAVRETI